MNIVVPAKPNRRGKVSPCKYHGNICPFILHKYDIHRKLIQILLIHADTDEYYQYLNRS